MTHEPERIDISAHGLRFAALACGPADGPLALLLHGFPDSASTWRHLLPALAGKGFRAVAPWLRGYAPTEVPPDGKYHTAALVRDANELHDALGGDERAALIGHDWGAAATYGAASLAPQRWRTVVTLAVPPPTAFMSALFRYEQLKRSFYMFVFQHPLAEAIVAADDLSFIDHLWADWSPGYDAGADVRAAKDAIGQPANLAAAIGYYRASIGMADPGPDLAAEAAAMGTPGPQPILYLHGRADGCAGVEMTDGLEANMVAGSRVVVVPDSGHFLHLEQPDHVNGLILDWVTAG